MCSVFETKHFFFILTLYGGGDRGRPKKRWQYVDAGTGQAT